MFYMLFVDRIVYGTRAMRETSKLTARQVETITKPGLHGDGGGLYLKVTSEGTRSWVLRYMLDGRARFMGLGPCPPISLKLARERALEERIKVKLGIDPIDARNGEREQRRTEAARKVSFKKAATEFLKVHVPTWKNPKHKQQWQNTLETYAYPKLGKRSASEIDDALINETLAPIWTTKRETASRVHQRIKRICKWIKDGRPLPKPSKAQSTRHHPALPINELPAFMADLRSRESISARALEFTILTAARTGEVIGATDDEIDGKVWTVPGERSKTGREHRVPLCDRALEILQTVPREAGNAHLFAGGRKGGGLSNMAMLNLLKGTRPDLTVHGFRSTFRDWCAEQTNYPREVAEAALAHIVADKVEAAYRRGDLFDKRARLMRDWCRYCQSKPAESCNVVAIGA